MSRRTLARHEWLQCLLTVMALGVAGLCAGASAGHATTTTAFPATYNYDYPTKFAQRAFGSPLRQTGSSARRSQRLHGEGASSRVGRRAGVAAEEEAAVETTGQLHHVISRPIAKAIEEHPNLSGEYAARDPRFTTRAVDQAAHRGYQGWHRALDDEVVGWLQRNPGATTDEFEQYLNGRYSQPDLKGSFPNGF